jgi:AmmeMemoRadiSam system protein B
MASQENSITVRPPAVAGYFYPAEPGALRNAVVTFLASAPRIVHDPKVLIAPHAGYIYSGPIAGSAYASWRDIKAPVQRVILLGPAHRVGFRGLALPSARYFATPLGTVPIDQVAASAIVELPQVYTRDDAHAQEHSLEVHVPFLQVLFGEFELVPLVVGDARPAEISAVLDALWGGDDTRIVVSSDLSHYHDYATAQAIDAATTEAIRALNYEAIGPRQACGCMPVRGLLYRARQHQLKVTVLDVRNSGDTAGTRDRVVGYGAYALN